MKKTLLICFIIVSIYQITIAQTVAIGNQTWMMENLNVSKFRNGDRIPQAKTSEEWVKAGETMQPAWCYYDNDPKNEKKYGKLYNHFAVSDARGLAPEGYHVATFDDWTYLEDNLKCGGEGGWKLRNASGFAAVPGGIRGSRGNFQSIEIAAAWWATLNENTEKNAWGYMLNLSYHNVGFDGEYAERLFDLKSLGLSVRCVKD